MHIVNKNNQRWVWVVRSLRWHWNGKEECSLSNCAFVCMKYRGGELKPFKRVKSFAKRVFHTIPYLNTLDSNCACGCSFKYKHDFKNNIFVHIRSGFVFFLTFVISHAQPQCLLYRCIKVFNLITLQRSCLLKFRERLRIFIKTHAHTHHTLTLTRRNSLNCVYLADILEY